MASYLNKRDVIFKQTIWAKFKKIEMRDVIFKQTIWVKFYGQQDVQGISLLCVLHLLMSLLHLEKILTKDECVKLFRSFIFKKEAPLNDDLNEILDEAFHIKVVKGTIIVRYIYPFNCIQV